MGTRCSTLQIQLQDTQLSSRARRSRLLNDQLEAVVDGFRWTKSRIEGGCLYHVAISGFPAKRKHFGILCAIRSTTENFTTTTCSLDDTRPRMPQQARYINWVNILLAIATVAVVALFAVGGITAWNAAQTSDDIFHNFQVHQEIRSVLSAIKDAETGERGFLISADEKYLERYHIGIGHADDHLEALQAYAERGEVSPERFARLRQLIADKRAEMEDTIAARRLGPDAEAFNRVKEIVVTDRGKLMMDQIRSITGEMLDAREAEMAKLQTLAGSLATQHFIMIAVGLLMTVGTFAAAAAFTNMERAERNRAAAKVHTERSRLQAVIDSSMDAVVAVDHHKSIVMFNPIAEDVFLRRERDVIGQPFQTLIPERFRKVFQPLIDDSSTGPPRTKVNDGAIISGMKTDGTEFPAEAVVSRSMVDGHALFTVILRDVTERETGRVRTREQTAVLSRIRDAIHTRDLEDRIQTWNDGAQKLYGWTAIEAIGKPGTALLTGTSVDAEADVLSRLLADGVWIGERQNKTRDGQELIIESRRSLIVDESGRPTSQLVIDVDITDDKRREQVERRSQRLESIGTLTSGIAHDLNNVLTPITMGAKLLRRQTTDPRQMGLLDTISSSAERGAAMIRQLLSFAGGTSGPREVVDIKQLIDEACSILEHTLTHSIRVQADVTGGLSPIQGDATELSQVLMNLAINARDAMADGGTLTFEAANVSLRENASTVGLPPGNYVRVSVIDTGDGIPADIIERIFDPFFTTKDQGKGTGLGLATCMGIVKSHDGNMSVYSEPTKGTKFTIYLPAQQGDVKQDVAALAEIFPEGRGQLILLVDDEESILQMAQATLESYGYRAITAVGGAAAVTMYEAMHAEIQLVIVDMMMPEVDGPMTIQAIRAIRSDAKIIASSGLRKPEHGKGSIEGSDSFLPKPYSDELLLQTIKNVLKGTA